MRTRPVNLTTARATAELFVIDFGKRLKFFNDIGLPLRVANERYSEDTA